MPRTRIAVVALALLAAACGGSSQNGDVQPRSTAPITTTLAPQDIAAPDGGTTPEADGGTTPEAGDPGTDPGTVTAGAPGAMAAVQLAMENAASQPPARIEGGMELSGTDPQLGRIEFTVPFLVETDSATGDGRMVMDFSGMADMLPPSEVPPEIAGMFDRLELRQVGDTAYMKFGLLNMMFGVETEWMAMPVEDSADFTQGFSSGVNPYDATSFLSWLSDSGGDLSVVGPDTIDGTAVTHYRLTFDLESLAELDPASYAELQEAASVGFDELPMDIWIDDQGRVRRYRMEINSTEISGIGAEMFSMRMEFDFLDYGGSVNVEPPPPGEVTHVDDLEDFFGGFGDLEA